MVKLVEIKARICKARLKPSNNINISSSVYCCFCVRNACWLDDFEGCLGSPVLQSNNNLQQQQQQQRAERQLELRASRPRRSGDLKIQTSVTLSVVVVDIVEELTEN